VPLLKSQKNDLVHLMGQGGFSPTDFELNANRDGFEYVGAGANPGEFFFRVSATLVTSCHPAAIPIDNAFNTLDLIEMNRWLRVASEFSDWLDRIRIEVEAPDLWAEVDQLRALVKSNVEQADDRGELPLVGKELDQLLEAINHVRALVEARADLADAKVSAMQGSLDRLEEGGRKYSRKDLTLFALGSVAIPLVLGHLTVEDAQWLLSQIFNALMATRVAIGPIVRALIE
jgi:hypothetical protein